ncbi:carbon storage regulator [Candidatus Pacearchaeota archaeon]|jgi:carbon storage regulator CsrA|nr:carbon storage regulator [Candidatus Pacearchaeota archaeon]
MLCLSRREGEKVVIDGPCTITVCEIRGGKAVRLGIDAGKSVRIIRPDAKDKSPRYIGDASHYAEAELMQYERGRVGI